MRTLVRWILCRVGWHSLRYEWVSLGDGRGNWRRYCGRCGLQTEP